MKVGYISRVASAIYGRLLDDALFSVAGKRPEFWVANRECHILLRLLSATKNRRLKSQLTAEARREAIEEKYPLLGPKKRDEKALRSWHQGL